MKVNKDEKDIDLYEDKLGSYLVKTTATELSKKQNDQLYVYLHSITDLERISDHAQNIAETAQQIHTKDLIFSNAACRELNVLRSAVTEVVSISTDAFVHNDMKKGESPEFKQYFDEYQEKYKI